MCVMFQFKINVMLYDAANSANNGYPSPLTIPRRSAQRERSIAAISGEMQTCITSFTETQLSSDHTIVNSRVRGNTGIMSGASNKLSPSSVPFMEMHLLLLQQHLVS